MDNGPEFVANITRQWSEMNEIAFKYIQPGKPTQNAFVERFNKTYRQGVLDAYLFDTIEELRAVTQQWADDYNNHRPHDALNGMPPRVYRTKQNASEGLRCAAATPPLHATPQMHSSPT